MQADRDYVLDRKARAAKLTPAGQQQLLLHARQAAATGLDRPWPTYVEQALQAELIFRRDVDYVIRDGKVLLVDEHTGRIFEDRSWRDGLHQAVQAKEQVPITTENRPIAQISRQRYFRLYDGLCGMSGTVTGAEREFHRVYGLSVVTIPTWKPCRRKVGPTRFFAQESAKWSAIVAEIERRQATGQPILVGTWSIQNSETLAQMCAARGSRTNCSTASRMWKRRKSWPRPGRSAWSPLRPTWRAAGPTSSSAPEPLSGAVCT